MANRVLSNARQSKSDEFYTQLSDIERELNHYKQHFAGKVVYCNCDDPFRSNFVQYFVQNFCNLALKKLVATCYAPSHCVGVQQSLFDEPRPSPSAACKLEVNALPQGLAASSAPLDIRSVLSDSRNSLTPLQGNGDFRSQECIDLLRQADIVCTNPPFSLFRIYIAQLVDCNKRFVVIGNKNCLAYKEIFTLFLQNKIWTGYRNINSDMWFEVPPDYACEKIVNGKRLKHIMGCWLTNLDTTKRHALLPLRKRYRPQLYPAYDNYDAINVDKVDDIPCDYNGTMGVPVTFLDKYNPEQFEIIDINPHFFAVQEQGLPKPRQLSLRSVGRPDPYVRILIRRL